ncbi:N-acetyltransferase [Cohnella xylanilytica]|uniref:GNAT family N-acetyltransferase n=1 Tax=Cohnella xylanilytica TaxID=557555 RepID=A0A841U8H4_9BACL|nr:GNAT family N-acetyltransferase [Cohnella xylanilytica]MBB6694321.1 GNAT family N-acetyltransferase [Cohnella xylanilytica]GIO10976.1 N-acetyltransferase [Cohnella xylanilytica]
MSSLNLIVRDATENDREAVSAVTVSAYAQYEEPISATGRWQAYVEELRASAYEGYPFARIVAETEEGEIVGSVQLFADSEAAYDDPELGIRSPIIRYLAVSPAARGRGVATLLLQESIRRSRARGADSVYLHTNDIMDAAIRLYERHGFRRAEDKDIRLGETLIKSFRLALNE